MSKSSRVNVVIINCPQAQPFSLQVKWKEKKKINKKFRYALWKYLDSWYYRRWHVLNKRLSFYSYENLLKELRPVQKL